jgi:hypothetical protein
MSRLSPQQQQALAGAWYSIVGQQPVGQPPVGHLATVGRWPTGYHGAYGGYTALQHQHPFRTGPYGRYLTGAEAPPAPAVMPPPMAMPPMPAAAHPAHAHQHYRIPPRNALVQDPGPERAGREVLPMSTGVAILPTQSAQITARPQRVAFRPERVFISAAGTSGGAADWVVNDIKIGNRSQFSQSGDVPGDMFATNAIDGFVSFETAQTAMDVVMVVTYIGLNESGVPFFASIVGTAAI